MMLLFFNLLQPQRPRLSLFVIVGAALVFIVGVSLVVYFYRRYKRVEKESEDDWDVLKGSLFVKATASEKRSQIEDAPASIESSAPVTQEASSFKGATREFASQVEQPSKEPEPSVTPEPVAELITPAPVVESRPTEMLASPSLREPISTPVAQPDSGEVEEDIWADLEIEEQPVMALEPEPPRVARVEGPSHREPFEPPAIEPLSPREQASTREFHSIKPPETESNERVERHTVMLGSTPTETLPAEPTRRETREFAAERVAPATTGVVESSMAGGVSRVSHRAPPGSILGLPAEYSHQPLILGPPARPDSETGIGGLTHYGEDLGPKGGRGGTIALAVVVILLAGGVASYLFVPSVHTRASAWIARVRGTDAQGVFQASKPKAQIIPSLRPEVNRNMVTARGAVDNISDEPLENLEIEVSLQHGGDAPPEMRRIPVTPNPLPPAARGGFQFEYDGKRDTGYAGYKITKLFSNGIEIKYRAPETK
jgi:hypothetical protein